MSVLIKSQYYDWLSLNINFLVLNVPAFLGVSSATGSRLM
jgi:hypothetical protein